MTSPAAAFAGLLNSSKGLVTSVPLAGTAEEEEDEEKDDEDEGPIGSRPSNTFLLTTLFPVKWMLLALLVLLMLLVSLSLLP